MADAESDAEARSLAEGSDDGDIADDNCRLCGQEFGKPDEDVPSEFQGECLVTIARPKSLVCGPCFYVQRGSFPGSSQLEVSKAIAKHQVVRKKFRSLRKAKVHQLTLKPKKRGRHEKLLLSDLVKKSEKEYVDFQSVNKLVSLKDWIASCKKPPKKDLRSDRERKKWIKENHPQIKFVKHPTTNEDAVAVEKETLMLVGHRKTAGREKKEEYLDKGSLKEGLDNAKDSIRVKTNSKEENELAQQKMDGADSEDDQSEADDKKDDSDSESSFGCRESEDEGKKARKCKEKDNKPAQPKTRAQPKKAENNAAPEASKPVEPDKGKVSKSSRATKAKEDRATRLKTGAMKAQEALLEISANMIWKSVIRGGEVERRVQKNATAEQDLIGVQAEFFENDSQVQSLLRADGMATAREYLTVLKDLAKALRTVNVADALQDVKTDGGGEICQSFIKVFHGMNNKRDHATLQEMLAIFAKRIFEGSAKDDSFAFFRFLSLREMETPIGLSLHKLLATFHLDNPSEKNEFDIAWPFLLKVQAGIFSDFIEKLRLPNGVEAAANCVPPWLKITNPDLDVKRWLPLPPTQPDQWHGVNEFLNETGFSSQIMFDLQRVIAALACTDHQPADGKMKTKLDMKHLALAAGGKVTFSNKVTQAMSSQTEWRTLWTEVLRLVKEHSERGLPLADLEAFKRSATNVCQMDGISAESAEVAKLLALLPAFHDEDFGKPEDGALFKEKLAEVAGWFGKFKVDFFQVASECAKAADEASESFDDAATLENYARGFPPNLWALPESCHDNFCLQCEMQIALELLSAVEPVSHLKPFLNGVQLRRCFKLPDGDELQKLTSLQKLARELMQTCNCPEEGPLGLACKAMTSWSQNVIWICDAKALELILANPSPSKPWDYAAILGEKHQTIASSLQCTAGLQNKISQLQQQHDLEVCLREVPTFEGVFSCSSAKMHLTDPMFAEVGSNLDSFIKTFLDALTASIKDFEEGQVVVFKDFSAKYSEVVSACEGWNIGSTYASHFEDNSKDTGESMEQLLAAKNNSGPAMKALASLSSHISASKELKDAIANAKSAYKNASTLVQDCDRMAGILLVAGVLLKDSASSADIKSTMDMASKSFGMSVEKLPPKMHKLFSEIAKQHGIGSGGEVASKKKRKPDPRPSESEKPEKIQREKKEKEDGKQGHKRKERKEKKTKKEKKAKKQKEMPSDDEDNEGGSEDDDVH